MSRYDAKYIQSLMDLPYAGQAESAIKLNGWWNSAIKFEHQRYLGGMDAFAQVLELLNSYETRMIKKSELYQQVMELRPRV